MFTDSREAASPVITGPGIPYETFMAVQWAGAAFAVTFVVIRLVSRWRGPGRIFWDDVCAVFAAILVLITACLWQWAARDMYYVLDLQAGLATFHTNYPQRLFRELNISLTCEIFFYTTLFLVKLSFILFFARLGSNVRGQGYIRWPAFALSFICYVVSIGDMDFRCLVNSTLETLSSYCISPAFFKVGSDAVKANCALDVVSDFAITIIPFTILWDVRIHMRKKMAFVGLFSLTLVTIAAAIARAVETDVTRKVTGQQDPSYMWMWGTIQSSLAVMVSCLSAFPQLFTVSARKIKPQWTPSETYYQRLRSRVRKRQAKSADPLHDLSSVSFNDLGNIPVTQATSYDSRRPVLRPEMGRAAARCSAVANPGQAEPDQILRQVEYEVVIGEKPASQQHMSRLR